MMPCQSNPKRGLQSYGRSDVRCGWLLCVLMSELAGQAQLSPLADSSGQVST